MKGIGISSALTIAFIVLRLCNVITWSWWWVLVPIWGGAVLSVVFGVVYAVWLTKKSGQ